MPVSGRSRCIKKWSAEKTGRPALDKSRETLSIYSQQLTENRPGVLTGTISRKPLSLSHLHFTVAVPSGQACSRAIAVGEHRGWGQRASGSESVGGVGEDGDVHSEADAGFEVGNVFVGEADAALGGAGADGFGEVGVLD